MNQYRLQQFDIAPDTDDPLDLSRALASRGVLEAIDGPQALELSPREWREKIAVAFSTSGLTPWRLPNSPQSATLKSTTGIPPVASVSATQLAQAWQAAAQDAAVSAVRLAVQDSASASSRGIPTVPRLLGRDLVLPWQTLEGSPAARIASIVRPAVAMAGASPIGWPLSIGVYPDASSFETVARLRAARHVRRGLANVFLLDADNPACDVLVAPCSLRDVRRELRSHGFYPVARVVLTRAPGLLNQVQFAASMDFLQRQVGAALIATGMPPDDLESEWINQFIISLSHRNTLDVAVWDADAWVTRGLGVDLTAAWRMPVVSADPDFLAASRLDKHLVNLAGRIERLGQTFTLGSDTAEQLGMDPRAYRPAELAGQLRLRVDEDYFRHEGDAASGGAGLTATVAAAEAQQAIEMAETQGIEPPGPPPLFADVTFFASDADGRRIDDTSEALQVDAEYTLELMLRAVPQGIQYRGSAPRQPLAPLGAETDMHLLVVVSAAEADFEIPEPVQRLRFSAAPGTELGPASFRVKPRRVTSAPTDLVALEIRVFYQLNLLEFLELKAEVVRSHPQSPGLGLAVPIFVAQRSGAKRTRADLLLGLQPQHLAIDVHRVDDSMRFSFTLQPPVGAGSQPMVLHGRQDLSLDALRPELQRARRLWEHIAVDVYSRAMQVGRSEFNKVLSELADTGSDLWTLLFKSGSQDGAMWAIARWLKQHPLADGAAVDVRLKDGAASFSFPWSMLYDAPDDGGKPDSTGFWGLRYSIGQTAEEWPRPPAARLDCAVGPSRMEFMLWDSFPNRSDQVAMLDTLMKESQGRFVVDTKAPVNNAPRFNRMAERCDADILYFYTHGHTRPAEADAGYDPVDRIKEAYSALPADEQAASGLKPLYDLVTSPGYQVDESWIQLSGGKLFLRKLLALEDIDLARQPVVLLNMCQSAQVMPGLKHSFVQFFLQRRARSVIGTECPMTPVFAHPFSERLLREFLAGRPLGEALRRTRAHFMREGNPLGLAYTLHGMAGTHYAAAVVP